MSSSNPLECYVEVDEAIQCVYPGELVAIRLAERKMAISNMKAEAANRGLVWDHSKLFSSDLGRKVCHGSDGEYTAFVEALRYEP